MLDSAVFCILVHIADQIQNSTLMVMSKLEDLKEWNIEYVLEQHMRAHLQDSPPCTCKRLTAAMDIQTALEDKETREEEQQRCLSHIGIVSLSGKR